MKKKGTGWIPYIVLGASFALLIFLNLFYHDHWLDSDMAAEMIFSQNMAESGHFFATPDWYYSTEFRFLYTHWLMVPLFHVLKSWHAIRMATNLISYGLMLAAYYFMMKPFGVRKGLIVSTSAILLLPFSETMMTHMAMGNTYLFHVMIVFFSFGLFLRLTGPDAKKKALWLALYLILSVICGVSGVRYLLALQCPLLLTAFLYAAASPEVKKLRTDVTDENWKDKLRDFFSRENREKNRFFRYIALSLWGLFAAATGYAVNLFYVGRQYVFQTYESINFIAVYQGVLGERIQNAFGSLIMLFGYIPDRSVLSLRGLISLISFVLLGVFVFCALRAGRICDGERGFTVLFLKVSFWLNVFVFVFTSSTMVPRYYLTTFIFVLPALCFYGEREERFLDRTLVCAVLTGCLLLATAKTTLSFIGVDKNADRKVVAEFLEAEGYSFGFATYWNANIVTELTNGDVEVANLLEPADLSFFQWSTPTKYYREDYGQGKTFLLLEAEEYAKTKEKNAALVSAGKEVYNDGKYRVLDYENRLALQEFAGQGSGLFR